MVICNIDMPPLRYVKSWFVIDLISSIPFDTIASAAGTSFLNVLTQSMQNTGTDKDENSVTNSLSTLKVLKLLRIFRALRVFSREEEPKDENIEDD